MNDKIDQVKKIALDFSTNAGMVNESSVKRKDYAEETIRLLEEVRAVMEDLHKKAITIKESNELWCAQDAQILELCRKIEANLNLQEVQLVLYSLREGFPAQIIAKIRSYNADLLAATKGVIENMVISYSRDLLIFQMDKLLIKKNERQMEILKTFSKMTSTIVDDAANAITGSGSNLKRGKELADKVQQIDELIKNNKKDEIIELIRDANRGWNIAIDVNKKSKSQYDFSKRVTGFMEGFFEEAYMLKNVVHEKHGIFETNLQVISVVTVIISMDFKSYLDILEILKNMPRDEKFSNIKEDIGFLVYETVNYVKKLISMNLDMTDKSHVDNEFESTAIDSTEKAISLFNRMRNAVKNMTDATAAPVEGSGKNIEIGKMIESLLREVTSMQDAAITEVRENPEPDSNLQKDILIVDDSKAIRQIVIKVLSAGNYQVIEAEDGVKALELLDGRKIDLILCDVNMPNMNGLEFLQKVKNDEKYSSYKFIPIVMLTTEAGESMKDKGKGLGAKTWMVKPFQPDNLLEKINLLIG